MDDFEKHVARRLSQRIGIVDFGTPEKPKSHIEAQFWKDHAKRPEHNKEFRRRCFLLISEGREKIGAFLIGNEIRWKSPGGKLPGDPFKIRNDNFPYYARLFVRDYPQYFHFFDFKKLKFL